LNGTIATDYQRAEKPRSAIARPAGVTSNALHKALNQTTTKIFT
jgi:hypothetical protein